MNEKFTNDSNQENMELANKLKDVAERTNPNPHFISELEQKLNAAHNPKPAWWAPAANSLIPTLSWVVLVIAIGLFLNWSIRNLIPNVQPASNETATPPVFKDTPAYTTTPTANITSTPQSGGYDWRGTRLYLNAPLPDAPSESNIYVLKNDEPATVETAHALAEKLGIQGEVYISHGLYPADTAYFITDGKQSLTVNSNLYFTYTADMAKAYNNAGAETNPNAEAIIEDFLQSHGFNFPHKISKGDLYGGYMIDPLSPDGYPMRYEFFSSRPMRVTLDENGQVLQFESNQMDYERFSEQTYNIISAQEAFQKLLDDNIAGGKIESAISSSIDQIKEWRYSYPTNEMITIYGYAYSTPALDPSQPAFNQIDGYTTTGNTNGFEALQPNTFIEATGQFIKEKGIDKFNVESWKISEYMQDGIVGNLTRENGQVLFQTEQGEQLIIQPDVPADLPMPYENAFVLGIRKGNIYEWTLIDDRMNGNGGGGGGGGGGQGFYKLNLSGTPVPFPAPTPAPSSVGGSYTVREGDTLISIAQEHSITVDELMQANGMNNATDTLITIGQQLIIPGLESVPSDIGQKIEGQRGLMNITIYNKPDGSQRVEYLFAYTPENAPYPAMMMLEGDNLQELQAYQNRPVEIWGTIDRYDERYAIPVVKVERFEIPYPDLQFQILRGTQKVIDVNGQPVVLFTTEDGRSYIQSLPGADVTTALLGKQGDPILLEAISIPDENFGGYPTLRVFSSAMAISPKNGQPIELTVTANNIYTADETIDTPESYTPPALTIEKVELMYYVTNPHWQVDHLDGNPLYIQPVWRFYGHYDNGGEFEVIVQALKQEYLLPELAPHIQGG